jgi:ketosteroid isomerase-like protein
MNRSCRATILLTCLCLAVFTPAWSQQKRDSRENDQRAIQAVDDATRKAAQARNANQVVDVFYADDGAAMYPNAPICTGKKALRKRWTEMLAMPGFSVDWHLTGIEVSQSGDLAYSPFVYEMTMPGPDGKLVHDRGKGLAVWKKQANGEWKGEADMFNSDLPAPGGAPH